MADADRVLERICDYQPLMRGLIAVLVVMTGLLAFSFLFLEPGTGSYAIALLDIGLLVVAFVLIGGVSLVCERKEP